jgi:hypothetical protein
MDNYPWSEFLIEAAEPEKESDPDTGTNEPVDTGKKDEDTPPDESVDTGAEPDPEMAEDLAGGAPAEAVDTGAQKEIEELKKQIEELKKKFDLETEVKQLKKRLDNISFPEDVSLNDSINQSASREIKYIKRAIRRFFLKNKTSSLTGNQQQYIISELDQHPSQSFQDLAAKLSPMIYASEQDIFDFIRNTDYRFRHRHVRESSVIDWLDL